ncbi:RecQ family ATP-dependent DNA helicase [Pseudorhodoferax sp. Leaf267]|uniref:RecQ family ATP-dependent DNA helicase n=1 Tax=Pseudorhodoferax sp. Leaf267 TaxID=1736316 RepID=UPI0006F6ABA0|nr:RecQ family ATP-dependent DNA helicase [Pseudorhodoferax sp. Leaf267]KQP12691.1 helicase [Pseudorhodoferax sp. Leaf267]
MIPGIDGIASSGRDTAGLAHACFSLDLEVGIQDSRIHLLAAVRGDTGQAFVHTRGDLQAALTALDTHAAGATFLLGHNLIAFDAPHLAAVRPGLAVLRLPRIDTLRLNPLAFPRNPYHHLVKHYQDGAIRRGQRNDPELDARLTLQLLQDQLVALRQADPRLLLIWHGLAARDPDGVGTATLFSELRAASAPDAAALQAALAGYLEGRGCATRARDLALLHAGWPLAYALAWISVAGGNSVMPPWVLYQFPQAAALVRALRDRACRDPACNWCAGHHGAHAVLRRWFPALPGFRPEPVDPQGRPLQQAIVQATLAGRPVLGILPTGTGKSICYQLPALSRYDNTGALTVVISPLVALMADQVAGLEARGVSSCAALNGLLSMPERADVLERVRLGDIALLLVSPEQLRSRALRTALRQRSIGLWVMDEAHCLSKWGQDFRTDYRYVARSMRELAGPDPVPPVLCLTATAKPDVVADIVDYFRTSLAVELHVLDGGSRRDNLDFAVIPTSAAHKLEAIHQLLAHDLQPDAKDGAIVYASSRRGTEEIAEFLRAKGWAAGHFHAGLPPESKKSTQHAFIAGELRVMAATNAFGMGIDKPDVRLVIHADVPGSLENYLQEAGRAGRDRAAARCVLLYAEDDVERQFGLSARSRLTQSEIQAILKSLRRLERRRRPGDTPGEVIATAGEILREDEGAEFQRDQLGDDTRVRTAVAWLEEARLLSREENIVNVFPSSLRVPSLDAAREALVAHGILPPYRTQLLDIIDLLLQADPDQGVSTDELMGVARLSPEGVRKALFDLEQLGISSNDLALTAYVHLGVANASPRRLEEASAMEAALLSALRIAEPDLEPGQHGTLHLRKLCQALHEEGHPQALPERVWRLLRSLAADGRDDSGGGDSLALRRLDPETARVELRRPWARIAELSERRRAASQLLLAHLAQCADGARGTDLLVSTTLGRLTTALRDDLVLAASSPNLPRLLDRALLWLHEQEVMRLNKGLAVFRPAMTIRLAPEKRGFAKADFQPLKMHYDEVVLQIHVMAEYAQRGLAAMADALRLALDYFSMERADFLGRWLPGREKETARETLPASWRAIVEVLDHRQQQRIVADEREQTSVLVLAGPGSGKTRVLVHRIAYLLRVRREAAHGIVALAYNRHAAVQIRQRLQALVGDDARGVTVLTCHALAMRLTGTRLEAGSNPDANFFDGVMQQATALLEGQGLAPEDADEQRERLLAGFRWMLVDEYQDIGPAQYALIGALAGRSRQAEDTRLSLFAVGDDDQNIYAFAGASVQFIRQFESDYKAGTEYLVENYRSSAHIIAVANRLIAPAIDRLKAAHPIRIDRQRRNAPPGGRWQALDPVARGRVVRLTPARDMLLQAMQALDALCRLSALDPQWEWARCAVIARQWSQLEPLRAYAEHLGLPVQLGREELPPFWRLRETQALLDWLRADGPGLVAAPTVQAWLGTHIGPWWDLLREALDAYALDTLGAEMPRSHLFEWLVDWGREQRRRQSALLLTTAHGAKGLEFDHVVVLDGGWEPGAGDAEDVLRRLAYVAVTRARETLTLARLGSTRRSVFDVLEGAGAALLDQPGTAPVEPPAALSRRTQALTPADVDIGFAGRFGEGHAVHAAIARLAPGDILQLRTQDERRELLDATGQAVGRLSRGCRLDPAQQCVAVRVRAVLVRRREDGDAAYQEAMRCARWEVVLPELVLAPA